MLGTGLQWQDIPNLTGRRGRGPCTANTKHHAKTVPTAQSSRTGTSKSRTVDKIATERIVFPLRLHEDLDKGYYYAILSLTLTSATISSRHPMCKRKKNSRLTLVLPLYFGSQTALSCLYKCSLCRYGKKDLRFFQGYVKEAQPLHEDIAIHILQKKA